MPDKEETSTIYTTTTERMISSQISIEPSNSDSQQRRIATAQRALLADSSIGRHIIVRESIAMSIHISRVNQSCVMLDYKSRQCPNLSVEVYQVGNSHS